MRSTAPERSKGARWGFTFSRSMMLPPSLQPSPMRCLPRQGDGERRCTMSALRNINTESRDSASDPEAAIAGGKCDRQAAGDRPLQRLRGTEGGLTPCFFLAWTCNRRHHQPMKASPYVRARANTQAFPPNRPVPCDFGYFKCRFSKTRSECYEFFTGDQILFDALSKRMPSCREVMPRYCQ